MVIIVLLLLTITLFLGVIAFIYYRYRSILRYAKGVERGLKVVRCVMNILSGSWRIVFIWFFTGLFKQVALHCSGVCFRRWWCGYIDFKIFTKDSLTECLEFKFGKDGRQFFCIGWIEDQAVMFERHRCIEQDRGQFFRIKCGLTAGFELFFCASFKLINICIDIFDRIPFLALYPVVVCLIHDSQTM